MLTREPHDRKIYWYIDRLGGRGKTTLIKHILSSIGEKAAMFNNNKATDIGYALDNP